MQISPIGIIDTCFKEKFGVPRQSMMSKEARGTITLSGASSHPDTVLHLNEFSHLWVLFLFHKIQSVHHEASWRPTVMPPGLQSPKKVGVFASRSPHRPNPIGMSVVKLEGINHLSSGILTIDVSGVDILDGSPVLDIKPYIPYADSFPEASHGWASHEIPRYAVTFSHIVELELASEPSKIALIVDVMQWDPRPRSQKDLAPMDALTSLGRTFAFRFLDVDIHWVIADSSSIHVVELKK